MSEYILVKLDNALNYSEKQIAELEGFLSKSRQEKTTSMHPGRGRNLSILAGDALEQLLLKAGVVIPGPYGLSENGKPYLTRHPELFFSLSHSGSLVAAVLASEPVGIDVEDLHFRGKTVEELRCLADRFFLPEEVDFMKGARRSEQCWGEDDLVLTEDEKESLAFYRIWTFKEAWAKAEDIPLPRILKEVAYDKDNPSIIQRVEKGSVLTIASPERKLRPEKVLLGGSFSLI